MEKIDEKVFLNSDKSSPDIKKLSIPNLRKIIILHEPATELSQCKKKAPPISDGNTRVIELSDKKVKMELRREFIVNDQEKNNPDDCDNNLLFACDSLEKNMIVKNKNNSFFGAPSGELRYCKKIMDDKGNEIFIVPKLPPGTVLIKQPITTTTTNNDDKNPARNFPDAPVDKFDLRKLEKSSFGIAKQFSPPKKRRRSQVRRNPSRGMKKKNKDENYPRPRLISIKRSGTVDECLDQYGKKRMKLTDVPYMNTRSITKKLYNVGATHETPNIHDEIEWKEWPVHGMHERPVYHPQVEDFSGHEITENLSSSEAFFPPFHREGKKNMKYGNINFKNNDNAEESFEKCMHETLHAVLAFSSRIMTSEYKKNMKNTSDKREEKNKIMDKQKCDVDSESLKNIEKLNKESLTTEQIKNEQMVNKNLFDTKLKISNKSIKSIKNHEKLQQVLERGTKNTVILLKTFEQSGKKNELCNVKKNEENNLGKNEENNLKKDEEINFKKDESNILRNHDDPCVLKKEDFMKLNKLLINDKKNENKTSSEGAKNIQKNDSKLKSKIIKENEVVGKHDWLKDLIGNTALLYCSAAGIHQDNLVNYIDTLDTRQCNNWLKSGY